MRKNNCRFVVELARAWLNHNKVCVAWYGARVFLVCALFFAAHWVGFLFGWLIGASESPIGYVVAPLVFGLLSAIGIHSGLRHKTNKTSSVLGASLVAVGICIFCINCFAGIRTGMYARTEPYLEMRDVIGESWEDADPSIVTMLYDLRWRAQDAGVSYREFEPYMEDVIKPILSDDAVKDKPKRIKEAIQLFKIPSD